ncbi:MAG TPA: hypothetical protein VJ964_06345 [Balneolaceae bacterium]|nr:hypothetical protein [Balneolaceae bacterium]
MKKTGSGIFPLHLLMLLIFFEGISGLLGGVFLVSDPTGSSLQMPLNLLDNAPFANYLIPGIILLLVLGVFPLIVLYGLWHRKSWSWLGSLTVSLALLIWIGVEVIMIGYHPELPLQLIYGILGLVLLVLTLMPSVQNNFKA